jgi:carbonic anhydrase/acetyltransferase-like protein (isoleucine patch superfamily)
MTGVFDFEGRSPILPEDGEIYIAPGACVIGDVVLETGASVWFNAVLRGDNERITIGAGTNIQDGCVLHTDPGFPLVIGADCTIGHKAIVHGCTLGDGVLVGMGAVVMNGAVIGDGALIGAGALVPEGKEVPPGALMVGAPARQARQLTPDQRAGLLRSAEVYRDKGRRYRTGLSASMLKA